jgi:uncharacterized protein YggE
MKQKFLVLLSALLVVGLLAACSSTPATATAAAATRTLAATGTGEVYITPDIAYINIGIHTEADSVTAALNDNNTQAQAISDTLTGLGVDVKDIQTSSFNVSPMTTYANDGTVSRKYYSVDNTVYVTVRDLNSMGKLLDAVVASGANTINGITFDVKDKDAANAQARDLAIQKAKADAQSIAKSAGVTLGDLQNVSINTSGSTYPMYSSVKAVGGGSVPVSAGQLQISVDATLTYAIK